MARLLLSVFSLLLLAGCAKLENYPSLAPRSAEAIDPRLPIVAEASPGTVEPEVARVLADAVAQARRGRGEFDRLAARAQALAGVAGARQTESWVVAQQALSALEAQHGVTTAAAANIDALAATRISEARWLVPATRAAIERAAGEVKAINDSQSAIIARLGARLGV